MTSDLTKSMPTWLGALIAIGGLMSGAGVMWTQIDQSFPAIFSDDSYTEFAKHFDEAPSHHDTMTYPDLGEVELAFYESDGCLLISAPGREPRWLTRRTLGLERVGSSLELRRPMLAGFASKEPSPCLTRGCRNPHKGAFTIAVKSKRDVDGVIWIEVHRRFADGCEHYQLRREADGLWDRDDEGVPVVCWLRCIHDQKEADETT